MSRASCSPAPDRDPTQEELFSQWNPGHWEGAVWLYHPTLHKPDFWAGPGTITLPDLPDLHSSEQIRAWQGRDKHSLWQKHHCPAKVRLLSATRLALISPHLLPSCSSAPPQRLVSCSCCRVQQFPLCHRQSQAAATGSGCAWVSPCWDLTLVVGLAAHVAPQVSPLPACWKA